MNFSKPYRFTLSITTLILLSLAIYSVEAQSDWWDSCSSIVECGMNVQEILGTVSQQIMRSSSGTHEYALTCPDGTVFRLSYSPPLTDAKFLCANYRGNTSPDNPPATDNTDCIITGENINIRSGPGTAYSIIATLDENEEFIATGQNNGWWYGIFNGESAWISGDVTTATGNTCNSLEEVDAPPAPAIIPTGNTGTDESLVDTVSCLNFAHLQPPASGIAQTEVTFAWTEATGAGFYELVIYDFSNSVAATFSTEATAITVNLGLVATGNSMSWEVRAYDVNGAYACVTANSGQISMQGDPNPPEPEPVQTEEPVPPEPVNCEIDIYHPDCM